MSLKDLFKGATVPAMLVGVTAAALLPLILRSLSGGGSRPLAKALLHKYLDMTDKVKELGAETQEQLRDLLAEVEAERQAAEAEEFAEHAKSSSHS